MGELNKRLQNLHNQGHHGGLAASMAASASGHHHHHHQQPIAQPTSTERYTPRPATADGQDDYQLSPLSVYQRDGETDARPYLKMVGGWVNVALCLAWLWLEWWFGYCGVGWMRSFEKSGVSAFEYEFAICSLHILNSNSF